MIFNVHFKMDVKNQYFQRHCRLCAFFFGRQKSKIMDVKSVFCSSDGLSLLVYYSIVVVVVPYLSNGRHI